MSASSHENLNQHSILFQPSDPTATPIPTFATIINTFEDSHHSDSALFKVSLAPPASYTLPAPYQHQAIILKIYDHRFANYLRGRSHKGRGPSVTEEDTYAFTEEGFLAHVMPSEIIYEIPVFHWSLIGEDIDHSRFENEVGAYQRLQSLQETHIPRFLGSVYFSEFPEFYPSSTETERNGKYIPGILIEYIPSFPLSLLHTPIPKDRMAELATDAVTLIRRIGTRGVLFQNVSLKNFLVKVTEKEVCDYKVVMIDFSETHLRGKEEGWEDWKEKLWTFDQEGVVGRALEEMFQGLEEGLWRYSPVYHYMIYEDL